MLNAVIIDDEEDIRTTLCKVLENSGYWNIIGQADNVNDGLIEIITKDPQVLFCDIKLRGGTAFDLLNKVKSSVQKLPAVVLNTGFSDFEFAQTALNDHGDCIIKILKKPFWEGWTDTEAQILAAAHKLIEKSNGQKNQEVTHLYVKTAGKYSNKIDVNSISYIKADSGGAHIITDEKADYFTYLTLNSILEKLKSKRFIRIHKSYIININKVLAKAEQEVKMESGKILPIGRSYRKEVATRFDII